MIRMADAAKPLRVLVSEGSSTSAREAISYRAAHSKADFSRQLDRLELPQPPMRIVTSARALRDVVRFPGDQARARLFWRASARSREYPGDRGRSIRLSKLVIARLVRNCALGRAIQYAAALSQNICASEYWVARSSRAMTIVAATTARRRCRYGRASASRCRRPRSRRPLPERAPASSICRRFFRRLALSASSAHVTPFSPAESAFALHANSE